MEKGDFRRQIRGLSSQSKTFNESLVSVIIHVFHVSKQSSTLTNKLEQSTSRVVVLVVRLHVCSKITDTLCEKSYLYFGGTSIVFVGLVFFYDRCFALGCHRHVVLLGESELGSTRFECIQNKA